jgi:4-hydroxy-4-methyl-2-oxoglutarate aldolase
MNKNSVETLGLIPKERICKYDITRPSKDIIEFFYNLPDMAGLVSRAMDRLGINGSIPAYTLSPIIINKRIVGSAITVRNVPSRYAPYHEWQNHSLTQLGEREAYFIAKPGDIIVIDAGGRLISSNLGPNSAAIAKSRGVIGAIVDGPVTGIAGIREKQFPVWCRGGTTITGHFRVDTIEINGIITCNNVQVAPGDLIIADDSGISVVPIDRINDVLEITKLLALKGSNLSQIVDAGNPEKISQAFKDLFSEK